MAKDPKSAEREGTPARKSGPASKAQAHAPSKTPVHMQAKVQSKTNAQVKEKAVALAAAAMLTLPLVVAPSPVAAQAAGWPPASPSSPKETTTAAGQEGTLIIRMERTFTVLGVGDGHTVFKDAQGVVFHIDPVTGDRRTLSADYFSKPGDSTGARSAARIRFTNVMIVSILGVDAHFNTVMRNARNETFTLDPKTGIKVLIKWPK